MSRRKTDVLTSGYVSMDHIIRIASPARIGFTSLVQNQSNVDINYGGCSVNIAYALCRLGMCALPILRVGEDFVSNGFKQFLVEGNVPLDGITEIPDEKTSVCYLLQDNHNDHITIFYPGAMDEKYSGPMKDEMFENVRLGVITVAPQKDNREFFNQCKKHNIPIVFGMKDDFDAFPEEFLKTLLTESEIIFSNEVERKIIEELLGMEDIEELFGIGKASIIVTTLGKDGSLCYIREEDGIRREKIGICEVEHVVDATGSGDGYMAGFIYGYLNGCDPKNCCELGSALSHFVLQKEGCCSNIPTEQELLAKAEENRMK